LRRDCRCRWNRLVAGAVSRFRPVVPLPGILEATLEDRLPVVPLLFVKFELPDRGELSVNHS
jgi:hypothetical protein